MRGLLALLVPMGGLVLAAAGTASPEAGIPAAHGGQRLFRAGRGPLTRPRTPGPGGGKPTSCPPDREE
jgi:hypothetical protein